MKKRILIGTLCLMPTAHGFHNAWKAFEEMDQQMQEMQKQMNQVFAEMAQQPESTKIVAPDYDLTMQETDSSVILKLTLAKEVTSEHVSVELDNDLLTILIDYKGRIELKVSGQSATLYAEQVIKHEVKDEKGHVQHTSAGSSHMSQKFVLPARVDFQRAAPHVDLTNGVLTVTLAKKAGAQKIAVTSSTAALQVNEQKDVVK